MAATAASWMLRGVSKSGSPADRPMTSRPAAFISSARLVIAKVGDGWIRDKRAARKGMLAFQKNVGGRINVMRAQRTRNHRARTKLALHVASRREVLRSGRDYAARRRPRKPSTASLSAAERWRRSLAAPSISSAVALTAAAARLT